MMENRYPNLTITVYPHDDPTNRCVVIDKSKENVKGLIEWCAKFYDDMTIAYSICLAIENARHEDSDYLSFHIEIRA